MLGKKSKKPEMEEKILDVDASIQGNVIFKDPVNLKINGKFEGNLTTRGNLVVGESAEIIADVIGECIIVAGKVVGDIIAQKSLKLVPPARLIGNVETPSLVVEEGALLNGNCRMIFDEKEITRLESTKKNTMSLEEVASYLEVEPGVVLDWAGGGRLQGRMENGTWRFERAAIDHWLKNEKLK